MQELPWGNNPKFPSGIGLLRQRQQILVAGNQEVRLSVNGKGEKFVVLGVAADRKSGFYLCGFAKLANATSKCQPASKDSVALPTGAGYDFVKFGQGFA